jgi:hypothetical protein
MSEASDLLPSLCLKPPKLLDEVNEGKLSKLSVLSLSEKVAKRIVEQQALLK